MLFFCLYFKGEKKVFAIGHYNYFISVTISTLSEITYLIRFTKTLKLFKNRFDAFEIAILNNLFNDGML